jgi:hypothetical protein
LAHHGQQSGGINAADPAAIATAKDATVTANV